ncbi:hypothetical protein [Ensifer canadensis]|jgi:hypothetical protein
MRNSPQNTAERSEPFRSNEGHDEIGRERKGDGEANEGFEHRRLLEPAERARVERKHDKAAETGGKKKEIGHVHSPELFMAG